jgi:arginase family enzyme
MSMLICVPLSGTDGIIKKIRDRVGTDNPIYLSIDIDTLDPACKYLAAEELRASQVLILLL